MLTLESGVIGSQMPTFHWLPTGAAPRLGSLGREVADLAALAKLELDPWQVWIMEQACTRREQTYWNPYTQRDENLWAAFEVAVMVSRQNGKSAMAEARQLAGLFLFGERLLIHSAHKFDTSKETFEHVLSLIQDCPDLDRELQRVIHGHGEEGLILKSGQRLTFRTRAGTAGGGRGFTSDCLFLDEAMYLTASQIASLMPTLSARPNPQVWMLGSAGNKLSVAFGRARRRAYRANEERLFYAEWAAALCRNFCPIGCREHDDPADPNTWLKTNPGAGIRISLDHIRAEYNAMGAAFDPAEFGAERLGCGDWPVEEDGWLVIDKDRWEAQHDPTSLIVGPIVLAVSVPQDRSYTAIAAVGRNEDGMIHGEITGLGLKEGDWDYKPGQQWAIKRVKDICVAQRPEFVVIDKSTQAGAMIPELEAAGIEVRSPSAREYAQSCGEFRSDIVPAHAEEPKFVHLDQDPLSRAVAGTDQRLLTGLWAWAGGGVDICPLEAVTLGCWGFKTFVYAKPAAQPWAAYG